MSGKYTLEQVQFMRENYSRIGRKELTERFNRTFNERRTVGGIASTLGRRRIKSGRSRRFEKGNIPWNAGTKGQRLTGANRASFRKGHVPSNLKPLWSERIESKYGYIEIKVPECNPHTGHPTRYRYKHVWVWEQKHGPVPKGHVVAFVDGNNLNCNIDNLMLLSRSELLHMNQHNYKNQPGELKPSVLALAKLEVKAGFRTCRRYMEGVNGN